MLYNGLRNGIELKREIKSKEAAPVFVLYDFVKLLTCFSGINYSPKNIVLKNYFSFPVYVKAG